MDEKKEEKIVIESQKEEIKTDTEKGKSETGGVGIVPNFLCGSFTECVTEK